MDVELDFGSRGNGAATMGDGWSTPEENETWTVGPAASLILPALAGPSAYVLRLELRPHVLAGRLPAQRLRVLVNGQAQTLGSVRADMPWLAVKVRM